MDFIILTEREKEAARKVYARGWGEEGQRFWRYLGAKYNFTFTVEDIDIERGVVTRPDVEEMADIFCLSRPGDPEYEDEMAELREDFGYMGRVE